MKVSSATRKYLAQWAETECTALNRILTGALPDWLHAPRDAVIIVPAFDESATWWQAQAKALTHQNIFWIWIFNAPDNLEDHQRYQDQADAFAQCQQHLTQTHVIENLTVGRLNTSHSVLLVDRFTRPLPHRQGVGLARKIGNDLGLQLIQNGLVKTPWLFNTDADASLPSDLLTHRAVTQCLADKTIGAFQYGFQHHPAQPEFAESTWCYDQYLRYHWRGLKQAQSPYAYTTVGSLLVASAAHYAAVRGFPKQSAGEDFYLLNKIRKLSPIQTLSDPIIKLSGRPSHRVPYGTGPTLVRWQAQNRHNTMVWPPLVYQHLKILLDTISNYLANIDISPQAPQQSGQIDCRKTISEKTSAQSNTLNTTDRLLKSLPPEFATALEQLGFKTWLRRAKLHQLPTPAKQCQSFHQWFDGLKTQQFIRLIAKDLPSISIADAANCCLPQQP